MEWESFTKKISAQFLETTIFNYNLKAAENNLFYRAGVMKYTLLVTNPHLSICPEWGTIKHVFVHRSKDTIQIFERLGLRDAKDGGFSRHTGSIMF